ncbi:hypothetical protein [Mycolicibacterium alvei]|uniref:Uncharacterized protein n=1 Tax=Mycolicibacterium alvei TaxID=67081 RepID=A0A6N4UP66_9MYCO|nr:hypothetical protein [Mycolicibacterium alvei]MCV6999872.1 hypothetical protein [Mycolicibacterium alvei]BBX25715.1 hypothetical protein MALV_08400 [Mycolicibacterium alvei]
MDPLELVPLLGALGAGSVIGNWFGGGRSRREVRSGILRAIATTETKRWATDPDSTDFGDFITAVRDLETAALVARIPRLAVRHYVVLAHAARQLSDDGVDYFRDENDFWGPIDGYFDTLVRDSADVLTRLAWRPWWTRLGLRLDLRNLRTRALEFDDQRLQRRLAGAQKAYGALPGKLGQLPGVKDPPQFVVPSKNTIEASKNETQVGGG